MVYLVTQLLVVSETVTKDIEDKENTTFGVAIYCIILLTKPTSLISSHYVWHKYSEHYQLLVKS